MADGYCLTSDIMLRETEPDQSGRLHHWPENRFSYHCHCHCHGLRDTDRRHLGSILGEVVGMTESYRSALEFFAHYMACIKAVSYERG